MQRRLLRSSEILALRWADIRWLEGKIRVSKRWAYGKDGETKTEASDGYVPMHPILAQQLREWHKQTPYAKQADFVFPSIREQVAFGRDGKLYGTDFVQNPGLYLIDPKTGFETAIAALPPGSSSGLELSDPLP